MIIIECVPFAIRRHNFIRISNAHKQLVSQSLQNGNKIMGQIYEMFLPSDVETNRHGRSGTETASNE